MDATYEGDLAAAAGFSTLRMEPCWMALAQAAGVAAAMAAWAGNAIRETDITTLHRHLLDQDPVLIYYRDTSPAHPAFKSLQLFGVRGAVPEWEARLDKPATEEDLSSWSKICGKRTDQIPYVRQTRGDFLQYLFSNLLAG